MPAGIVASARAWFCGKAGKVPATGGYRRAGELTAREAGALATSRALEASASLTAAAGAVVRDAEKSGVGTPTADTLSAALGLEAGGLVLSRPCGVTADEIRTETARLYSFVRREHLEAALERGTGDGLCGPVDALRLRGRRLASWAAAEVAAFDAGRWKTPKRRYEKIAKIALNLVRSGDFHSGLALASGLHWCASSRHVVIDDYVPAGHHPIYVNSFGRAVRRELWSRIVGGVAVGDDRRRFWADACDEALDEYQSKHHDAIPSLAAVEHRICAAIEAGRMAATDIVWHQPSQDAYAATRAAAAPSIDAFIRCSESGWVNSVPSGPLAANIVIDSDDAVRTARSIGWIARAKMQRRRIAYEKKILIHE